MEAVFATQSGCVCNTTASSRARLTAAPAAAHGTAPAGVGSGLGGQIGELAAALNTVGWNHNRVPPEERIPLQERE
jgi:hypothetical protein